MMKPETMYRVVMWVISIAFAGFLVGLGSKIIHDLPLVQEPLRFEDFEDKARVAGLEAQAESARQLTTALSRQREQAYLASSQAHAAYNAERESFHNWLGVRGITEDDTQNPEVVVRARRLESLNKEARTADQNREQLDRQILTQQQAAAVAEEKLAEQRSAAGPPYEQARRRQELSIFGIRLAFTLPLLLAGIFAFRRTQRSKYWPLWRGFIGFTLFTFFVELVPYLPSYGGYVRYVVGVVLTLLAGHYMIKWMQAYLARRREAEKQAEAERRVSLERDGALRKMAANQCPSCDRALVQVNGLPASFCVHCGLNLFRECPVCHARMNSFFIHCGQCGKPMGAMQDPPAPPVPQPPLLS